MTTIRQANRKRYVSISNDLAQNNSLSLRARGLILYLLSLPDDWKIHINHLRKVLKEGERTIVATINELKDANYIKFHKMGFKEGWHYFVFEAPIQEDAFKEFLRTTAVCEDFANAKSCRNAPPLQKTNSNLQRNNSSTEGKPSHTPQTPTTSPLLPLTKEEEGLFAQRMKEIPKPPKYKSIAYKRKVLDSLKKKDKASTSQKYH